MSKKKLPHAKIVQRITPEIAQKWINELNKDNYRKPSWGKVREYSVLMKNGKWVAKHPDGIQFDWFGNLGNGQHRLLAVIDSGVSIEMWVEEGIDPEAFRVTDKPFRRTNGHDLAFAGFRKDVSSERAAAVSRRMLAGLSDAKMDDIEVRELAMAHQDLIGVMILQLKGAKPNRSEVTAAFCKATFDFSDGVVLEAATRYATRRFSGEKDDPLSKLHDKVVNFRIKGGKATDLYSFAVASIRAELEGRKLGNLQLTTQDFVGPWEEGYVTPDKRQSAKKGWDTVRESLRGGDKEDRLTKAREVLARARQQNVVFSFVGGSEGKERVEWHVPPRCPPMTSIKLNELRAEVAELLLAERASGNGNGVGSEEHTEAATG